MLIHAEPEQPAQEEKPDESLETPYFEEFPGANDIEQVNTVEKMRSPWEDLMAPFGIEQDTTGETHMDMTLAERQVLAKNILAIAKLIVAEDSDEVDAGIFDFLDPVKRGEKGVQKLDDKKARLAKEEHDKSTKSREAEQKKKSEDELSQKQSNMVMTDEEEITNLKSKLTEELPRLTKSMEDKFNEYSQKYKLLIAYLKKMSSSIGLPNETKYNGDTERFDKLHKALHQLYTGMGTEMQKVYNKDNPEGTAVNLAMEFIDKNRWKKDMDKPSAPKAAQPQNTSTPKYKAAPHTTPKSEAPKSEAPKSPAPKSESTKSEPPKSPAPKKASPRKKSKSPEQIEFSEQPKKSA